MPYLSEEEAQKFSSVMSGATELLKEQSEFIKLQGESIRTWRRMYFIAMAMVFVQFLITIYASR